MPATPRMINLAQEMKDRGITAEEVSAMGVEDFIAAFDVPVRIDNTGITIKASLYFNSCGLGKLPDLSGTKVDGFFYCMRNNIKSLEGVPTVIGNDIHLPFNPVSDFSAIKPGFRELLIDKGQHDALLRDCRRSLRFGQSERDAIDELGRLPSDGPYIHVSSDLFERLRPLIAETVGVSAEAPARPTSERLPPPAYKFNFRRKG